MSGKGKGKVLPSRDPSRKSRAIYNIGSVERYKAAPRRSLFRVFFLTRYCLNNTKQKLEQRPHEEVLKQRSCIILIIICLVSQQS